MRVCFINAPYDGPIKGIWTEMFPPLSLLCLAAYLRQEKPDYHISIVDGLRLGFKKTLLAAMESKADLYAVSFLTFNASTAYRMINQLKARNPDVLVVAGGTHVTSLEQDAFIKSNVDYVVHGEGERSMTELVDALENNRDVSSVRGILYRQGDSIHRTDQRPLLENLDALPMPARDLVDMTQYSTVKSFLKPHHA